MSATAIRVIVTARNLAGVSHEKRLAASHARMPVAPAAAVEAAIMHWAHMAQVYARGRSAPESGHMSQRTDRLLFGSA